MIIVLEGPDGVGKTTICECIRAFWESESGEFEALRHGPPGSSALSEYTDSLLSAVDWIDGHESRLAVFDRLHIGEMVYGPMLRGVSQLSIAEADQVDARLLACGALLVHVTAESGTIRNRLVARDGGLPDAKSGARLEQSYAIKVAYDALLGRYTGSSRIMHAVWLHTDTSNVSPSSIAVGLVDLIRSNRNARLEHPLAASVEGE